MWLPVAFSALNSGIGIGDITKTLLISTRVAAAAAVSPIQELLAPPPILWSSENWSCAEDLLVVMASRISSH